MIPKEDYRSFLYLLEEQVGMRKKTFYFSQLAPLHWKEKRGSRGLGRENERKADVLTCLGACSRNVRLDRDN